eukprot:5344597-Alexandrium_andersonii.AAC.1
MVPGELQLLPPPPFRGLGVGTKRVAKCTSPEPLGPGSSPLPSTTSTCGTCSLLHIACAAARK